MKIARKRGSTSNWIRVKLKQDGSAAAGSQGKGKTGLTISSTGLIISTIADNEATATVYTAAGSTIETITTLGTFATPTAAKCRFKEIDATNHPGWYEIQLADARFAVSSSKSLGITISGVSGVLDCDVEIQLTAVDVDSAATFMTGVNGLAPPTRWNLLSIDLSGRVDLGAISGSTTATSLGSNQLLPVDAKYVNGTALTARDIGASVLISAGTGTGQLDVTSGVIKANLVQILATALTETAGQIAAAFKKFFNIGAPAATMDHLILVDTVTTYTGNTPQTGDSYPRLGAPAGASHAADVAAVLTAVNNINNLSALANLFGTAQMEVPDSSSILYPFVFVVKDAEGHLLDLSGTPTITVANGAGTDRSANLSAVSHPSTGQYTFTYSVSSAHADEGLQFKASGTASSDSTTRLAYFNAAAVNADTITTLNAIKAKTDSLAFTNAGKVDASVELWRGTQPLVLSSQQVQAVIPTNATIGTVSGTVTAGALTGLAQTHVFLAMSQDGGITTTPGGNSFGFNLTSGVSPNQTIFDNMSVYVQALTGSAAGQQAHATISGGKLLPDETMALGIGDEIRVVPEINVASAILRTPTNRLASSGIGTVTVGAYASGQDPLTLVTGGANTIFVDTSHRVKGLDSGGNAFTYVAPDNADILVAATNAAALIQMTSGTGAARAFSVAALANAPAGGGGGGGTTVNEDNDVTEETTIVS